MWMSHDVTKKSGNEVYLRKAVTWRILGVVNLAWKPEAKQF